MSDPIDLRALREQLDWTQEDMASYLGIDRSRISRIENGEEPSKPVQRLLGLLRASMPPMGRQEQVAR